MTRNPRLSTGELDFEKMKRQLWHTRLSTVAAYVASLQKHGTDLLTTCVAEEDGCACTEGVEELLSFRNTMVLFKHG